MDAQSERGTRIARSFFERGSVEQPPRGPARQSPAVWGHARARGASKLSRGRVEPSRYTPQTCHRVCHSNVPNLPYPFAPRPACVSPSSTPHSFCSESCAGESVCCSRRQSPSLLRFHDDAVSSNPFPGVPGGRVWYASHSINACGGSRVTDFFVCVCCFATFRSSRAPRSGGSGSRCCGRYVHGGHGGLGT